MKSRHIGILAVLLALLAGAAYWVVDRQAPMSGRTPEEGLLEDLPWDEVSTIRIVSRDGGLTVEEQKGRWVVEERFGYPADFALVSGLANRLRRARVGRSFETDQAGLARLGLLSPEEGAAEAAATLVELRGAQGEVIAAVFLGRPYAPEAGAPGGAGQYLRVAGRPEVLLVDSRITAPADPVYWLRKDLTQVIATEVAEVVCTRLDRPEIVYRLTRNSPGGFDLVPPPAKAPLDPSKADRLAEVLSNMRVSDVAGRFDPAAEGGLDVFAGRIEFRLFNGLIYRIYPGRECRDEALCPLMIEVDYDEPGQPEAAAGAEAAAEAAEAGKELRAELTARAEDENERLGGWIFLVPEWQHAKLVTTLEGLLQDRAGGTGQDE